VHNTATIHKAQRLICGCLADTASGETFTRCARHACHGVVSLKELPVEGIDPLPVKRQASVLLCPGCGSVRIKVGKCLECGEEFGTDEIIGVSEAT